MKTIETTVTVTEDGKMTIQVPSDIPPGEHHIVMVIEEQLATKHDRPSLNLPARDYGPWPERFSLRREDMYGEWGR